MNLILKVKLLQILLTQSALRYLIPEFKVVLWSKFYPLIF